MSLFVQSGIIVGVVAVCVGLLSLSRRSPWNDRLGRRPGSFHHPEKRRRHGRRRARRVRYDMWIRFMLPLMRLLAVASIAMLAIAALLE
jgi:hypothetical protein